MPKFNFVNNCLHTKLLWYPNLQIQGRKAGKAQPCIECVTQWALSPWQQEHKIQLSLVSRPLSCPCRRNQRLCLCILLNKLNLALLLAFVLSNVVVCLAVWAWDLQQQRSCHILVWKRPGIWHTWQRGALLCLHIHFSRWTISPDG